MTDTEMRTFDTIQLNRKKPNWSGRTIFSFMAKYLFEAICLKIGIVSEPTFY